MSVHTAPTLYDRKCKETSRSPFLATEGIGQDDWVPITISVIDTPTTTSAVTYTVRQRCTNGSSAFVGLGTGDTGSSNIILMEIL